MVSIDDLQKPSKGMSKIIVAIGIGLFSLLILNIFDILSFWTLAAVLVGVALVLKFGAPSIGAVATLAIAGLLVIGIVQVVQLFSDDMDVFDASVEQGIGNWIGGGGAKTGGEYFKFPPGSSIKQKFDGTTASVALFNIELAEGGAEETQLEISIVDQYNYESNLLCVYHRSARTSFTVRQKEVIPSGEIKFGNSMELLNLKPGKSETLSSQQGNFASLAVDKKYVACGYGTAGKFDSLVWKICPEGYQSRDIKRPYIVTIRNLGNEKILIDEIRVIKN